MWGKVTEPKITRSARGWAAAGGGTSGPGGEVGRAAGSE